MKVVENISINILEDRLVKIIIKIYISYEQINYRLNLFWKIFFKIYNYFIFIIIKLFFVERKDSMSPNRCLKWFTTYKELLVFYFQLFTKYIFVFFMENYEIPN